MLEFEIDFQAYLQIVIDESLFLKISRKITAYG